MGSSKIQEYNLDPNCGFAKEDTAQEILSAVANGVEPSFRSPISIGGGFFQETGTVCNITGCGEVHMTEQHYNDFTVTVDGVKVCDKMSIPIQNGFSFEFSQSLKVDYIFNGQGGLQLTYILY